MNTERITTKLHNLAKEKKRIISLLLAVLVFITSVPLSGFEVLADETPVGEAPDGEWKEQKYEGGGAGTSVSPFILTGETDFRKLQENMEHIPAYSYGKYFKVRSLDPLEDTIAFAGEGDKLVQLGDMSDNANMWFGGYMDLNGYVFMLRGPLFGTLAEGAVIRNGRIYVDDANGTVADSYEEDWGPLAKRIVAVDSELADGNEVLETAWSSPVKIQDLMVSAEAQYAGAVAPSTVISMGGAVGAIHNDTGSEDLRVEMHNLKVGAFGDFEFDISGDVDCMGGIVGELVTGTGESDGKIELNVTSADMYPDDPDPDHYRISGAEGMFSNTRATGLFGGFAGKTTENCVIRFGGPFAVCNPNYIDAANKALFVGKSDGALIYFDRTMEYTGYVDDEIGGIYEGVPMPADPILFEVDQTETPLSEIPRYGNSGSFSVTDITPYVLDGTVFNEFSLDTVIAGTGTKEDPYQLDGASDLLLLSAALRLGKRELLCCFRTDKSTDPAQTADADIPSRDDLAAAWYVLYDDPAAEETNVYDLSDTGFMGLGYYNSEDDMQAFSGSLNGQSAGEDNIKIVYCIETEKNNAGFIPVLTDDGHAFQPDTAMNPGFDGAAGVRNIDFEGALYTKGSNAGGIVGRIGHEGGKNAEITAFDNVTCSVNIETTESNRQHAGGFVGFADYTGTGEEYGAGEDPGKNWLVFNNCTYDGEILTSGNYAGGMVGLINAPSQAEPESSSFGLKILADSITVDSSIAAADGSSAAYLGGMFGAIETYDRFETSEDSDLNLQYETVDLTAESIVLNGALITENTNVGGFAASMSGVHAFISGLNSTQNIQAGGIAAGIAATAAGHYQLNDICVDGSLGWEIGTKASDYSGILFGTTKDAWIELGGLSMPGFEDPEDGAVTGDAVSSTRFADLSGRTFSADSQAFDGRGLLQGGLIAVTDQSYTKTGYDHSDSARYYLDYIPGFDPAENGNHMCIHGSGTQDDPFLITNVEELQALSLFMYLSPVISWRMMGFFPEAAFTDASNDIDRINYLRSAWYRFENTADNGVFDLTGKSYYPIPITGGNYIGVKDAATIIFSAETPKDADGHYIASEGSTGYLSSTRENNGGLFTSISPQNGKTQMNVSGFTLKGTVAGTYHTGSLFSGMLIRKQGSGYTAKEGLIGGSVQISGIDLDGVQVRSSFYDIFGTEPYDGSDTFETGLLIGSLYNGQTTVNDVNILLPADYRQNYSEDSEKLAGALVGYYNTASASVKTDLIMQRILYPTVETAGDAGDMAYFSSALFIDSFQNGVAYYYHDPNDGDEAGYVIDIDRDLMPRQGPSSAPGMFVEVNPARNMLDRGIGTERSPFIIDSASQLYGVASVLMTGGATLGSSGILKDVNGQEMPSEDYPEATNESIRKRVTSYLASAFYRITADIDYTNYDSQEKQGSVSLYPGIGTREYPFSGSMDGRGHRIIMAGTGENGESSTNLGLFGVIKGADIKNMIITTPDGKTANIMADGDSATYNGLVASIVTGGDNIIDNVIVGGNVNITDGTDSPVFTGSDDVYVGGYVGCIEAGTVNLYNMPENYATGLTVTKNGVPVSSADEHFAVICPYVLDGYLIYQGDDSSTALVWENSEYLTGTVNQPVDEQVGPSSTRYTTYTYSYGTSEGVGALPSDLGLSLSATGILSGRPTYAGQFKFAVQVKADTKDAGGNVIRTTYDVKVYTLDITKAMYPAININTRNLQNLTYKNAAVDLKVSNFPQPGGNHMTKSTAEGLIYYLDQGAEVLEHTQDADGNDILEPDSETGLVNIIGTGHVRIRVVKPEDTAYYEISRELEFDVSKAELMLSLQDFMVYVGNRKVPENYGVVFVEGLRGTEGKVKQTDENLLAQMAAAGINPPTVTYDAEITPEVLSDPLGVAKMQTGLYDILINPLTNEPGYDSLKNYRVHYDHGVVQVAKKSVSIEDYEIYVGSVDEAHRDKTKLSDVWYNGTVYIVPAGDFEGGSIYTDATGYVDHLEFPTERNKTVVKFQLSNSNFFTKTGAITFGIDLTAPTAEEFYVCTQDPQAPYFNFLGGNEAVYHTPFTLRMTGEDASSPRAVNSGIHHLEYLYFTKESADWDATLAPYRDTSNKRLAAEWRTAAYSTGFTDINDDGSYMEKEITGNISGAYFLRAVDNAGNYSDIVRVNYDGNGNSPWFYLDQSDPDVTVTNASEYGTWRAYNGGLPDISIAASDTGSGIGQISYSVDGGAEVILQKVAGVHAEEALPDGAYVISALKDIADGIHTVEIFVTDRAGHTSSKVITIQRDTTVPDVEITKHWTDETGAVYQQDRTFTARIASYNDDTPDGTVLSKITSVTVTSPLGISFTPVSVDGVPVAESGLPFPYEGVHTFEFGVNEDGLQNDYTMVVTKESRTNDSTGVLDGYLKTTEIITVPKVDNKAPEITITAKSETAKKNVPSGTWVNDTLLVTVKINPHHGTTSLYGSLASDPQNAEKFISKLEYIGEDSASVEDPWKFPENVNQRVFRLQADENTGIFEDTLSLYGISESGVTGTNTSYIAKIDEVAPSITKLTVNDSTITEWLNKLTFGLLFNNVTAKAYVVENNSGLVSAQTQLTVRAKDAYDTEGNELPNSVSYVRGTVSQRADDGLGNYCVQFVIPNRRGYYASFQVDITDVAGNHVSDSFGSDIMVDNQDPEFTMELDARTAELDEHDVWNDRAVTVNLSGIRDAQNAYSTGIYRIIWWRSSKAVTGASIPQVNGIQAGTEYARNPGSNVLGPIHELYNAGSDPFDPTGNTVNPAPADSYSFTVADTDGDIDTPDGSYYVAVAVFDRAGNRTVQCRRVQKDGLRPENVELDYKADDGTHPLERVGTDTYVVKSEEYLRVGKDVIVRYTKEGVASPVWLKVDFDCIDGGSYTYWIEPSTVKKTGSNPNGPGNQYETKYTLRLPEENVDPDGNYTFRLYYGNYGPQAYEQIPGYYETHLVNLSTLITGHHQIDDGKVSDVFVLNDTDDDADNDLLAAESQHTGTYRWLQNIPGIRLRYDATPGAPEWIQYAVYSGKKSIGDVNVRDYSTLGGVNRSDGAGRQDDWTEPATGSVLPTAGELLGSAETGSHFVNDGFYTVFFRVADKSGAFGAPTMIYIKKDSRSPVVGSTDLYSDAQATKKLTNYKPLYGETDRRYYGSEGHFREKFIEESFNSAFGEESGVVYHYFSMDGQNFTCVEEMTDTASAYPHIGNYNGPVWYYLQDSAGNRTETKSEIFKVQTGKLSTPGSSQMWIDNSGMSVAVPGDPTWYNGVAVFYLSVDQPADPAVRFDHYEYRTKNNSQGDTEFSAWTVFAGAYDTDSNGVPIGRSDTSFGYDASMRTPQPGGTLSPEINGAMELEFRAVTDTGIVSEALTYSGEFRKDTSVPAPQVQAFRAVSGTPVYDGSWTNSDVTFRLSNGTWNASPVYYYVKIDGFGPQGAYGKSTMLPLSRTGSDSWNLEDERGKTLDLTWNADSSELTLSGDTVADTKVTFTFTSAAGRSASTSSTVSLQKTSYHLKALSYNDFYATAQPSGRVADAEETPWRGTWYCADDTKPDICFSDDGTYYGISQPAYQGDCVAPISLKWSVTYKDNTGKNAEKTETYTHLLQPGNTGQKLLDIDLDRVYEFRVWLADAAGNTTEKTNGSLNFTVRADFTKPAAENITLLHGTTTWRTWLANTFRWLFQNDSYHTVEVGCDASTSGLNRLSYIRSDLEYPGMNVSADGSGWIDLTRDANGKFTFDLEDTFTGMIFVRVEDEAGNVTVTQTDGLMIETAAPQISYVRYTQPRLNGWYAVNPEFTITVSDETQTVPTAGKLQNSGISSYVVEEVQNGEVKRTTTVTRENPDDTGSITLTEDLNYTTQTQGEFDLRINAVDRAGNQAEEVVIPLKVDAYQPALDVVLTRNTDAGDHYDGTWTKDDVVINFTASNFASDVVYSYRVGDGEWEEMPYAFPGSHTRNRMVFSEDYNETLQFKVTNKADLEVLGEDASGAQSFDVKVQKSWYGDILGFCDAEDTQIFEYEMTGGVLNEYTWFNTPLTVEFYPVYRLTRQGVRGVTKEQSPVTTHFRITDEQTGQQVSKGDVKGNAESSRIVLPLRSGAQPDGRYTVDIWADDTAGNTTAHFIEEYQVDTTRPNGAVLNDGEKSILKSAAEKLMDLITFSNRYSTSREYEFHADFAISGPRTIHYIRVEVDSAEELEALKNADVTDLPAGDWEELLNRSTGGWMLLSEESENGTVYEPGEFVGLYFFRLEDKAGNVTVVNSNGVVVDTRYDGTLAEAGTYGSWTSDYAPRNEESLLMNDMWYRSAGIYFNLQETDAGVGSLEILRSANGVDGWQRVALLGPEDMAAPTADYAGYDSGHPLYNQPFDYYYSLTENGVYYLKAVVSSDQGHTREIPILNAEGEPAHYHIDNHTPKFTVKATTADGRTYDGSWTAQNVHYELKATDTNGQALLAPVTYWMSEDLGASWNRIFPDAGGKYVVDYVQDTNKILQFRALAGSEFNGDPCIDPEHATYVVYEGTYSGTGMKATKRPVRVQKTFLSQADLEQRIALYFAGGDEPAVPDTDAVDGWINSFVDTRLRVPQRTANTHANIITDWTLAYKKQGQADAVTTGRLGTIPASGDWKTCTTDLYQTDMHQDGIYVLTFHTYDQTTVYDQTDINSVTVTVEVRVDTTAPALNDITISGTSLLETGSSPVVNLANQLTFGLFFKRIPAQIDIDYNESGRQELRYFLASQVTGTAFPAASADPADWTVLEDGDSTVLFDQDFRGVIYVKCMDNAGNETQEWYTRGLVADSTAPELSMQVTSENPDPDWERSETFDAQPDSVVVTPWLNNDSVISVRARDMAGSADDSNENQMNTLSFVRYEITRLNTEASFSYIDGSDRLDSAGNSAAADLFRQTKDVLTGEDIQRPDDKEYRIVLTEDGDYRITVTAEDMSGNRTERSMQVRVDKSAPTGGILELNGVDCLADSRTIKYFNRDFAAFRLEADTDVSGLYRTGWQVITGRDMTLDAEDIIGGAWRTDSLTGYLNANCHEEYFTVFMRITDNAGNSTIWQSALLCHDSIAPSVILTEETIDGDWSDQPLHIYADVRDDVSGYGVSGVRYQSYPNGVSDQPEETFLNGDQHVKLSVSVSYNGVWTFRVTDLAGNTTTSDITVEDLDLTAYAPDLENWNSFRIHDEEQFAQEVWHNEAQTVTVSMQRSPGTRYTDPEGIIHDMPGADEWIEYQMVQADPGTRKEDISWPDEWISLKDQSYEAGGRITASVMFPVQVYDQTTAVIRYRIRDELNRTSPVQSAAFGNYPAAVVNMDTTAPDGNEVEIYGVQQNLRTLMHALTAFFFNDTIELHIHDNNAAAVSGTEKIEYLLSNDAAADISGAAAASGWKTYYDRSALTPAGTQFISPQYRGIVYVRVTDRAGNSTIVPTSLEVVVENTVPQISVRAESGDEPYEQSEDDAAWTKYGVKFTLSEGTPATLAGIDHYEFQYKSAAGNAFSDWMRFNGNEFYVTAYDNMTQTNYLRFRAVSNTGIGGGTQSGMAGTYRYTGTRLHNHGFHLHEERCSGEGLLV